MTVRFKCQSEYQKSYRASRSRSVSPQRCTPLAGLRSDQMGISREPGLQRRRRFGPVGPARSCSSLLFPPDVQHSQAEPAARPDRTAPSAGPRSRSAHRKEPSPDSKPPTNPRSPTEPATPTGPRPAPDPGPAETPHPGPPGEPVADGKSAKPLTPQPDNQPQLSRPLTAAPDRQLQQQQPPPGEVERVLRRKAGLRSGGQRLGGQRSEYNRQFSWKTPVTAASPILTAEQMYSSSRSVPPFKKNPVSVETEYRRCFQGLVPPAGPLLRKHLEHQRVPLFHTHMTNRRRREESQKKPCPEQDGAQRVDRSQSPSKATPPPQRQRAPRNQEGGGATDVDAHQVRELRQKALSYRHRAWGTNFSRDHLSQLLSEHNALWEPTDTTDSATDPSTHRPTSDLSPDPDSRGPSCVEALDLASNSSKRSSVEGSGDVRHANKKTNTQTTPPGPPAERRTAWGEEEEDDDDDSDEEEGRLPTPRLKTRPVQRTHHDLTTPATGGAILVGKLRSADKSSPQKRERCGSAVSTVAGLETAIGTPIKLQEAWSENVPASPNHRPTPSPASKPIRVKQTPPSPAALPPPPAQHGIHGTLRHPEFQHNGQLGLRFRELQCPGGGCCGDDDDDRLSVMSWRSAASCSMASAVLERAQKRRENFWGKR